MQNTGDGTQKEEQERTKNRAQNQKEGVVAWASRVRRETRIQGRRSKLGGVGGWAVDDKRTEGVKQAGTRKNVYYMRMHLLAGGSDLLEGDCFSISPRQSSNTLAIEGENIRICWVGAIDSMRLVRTDIYIILCASLDPGSVILSCETLTFVGRDLSEIPIRTQVGTLKAATG